MTTRNCTPDHGPPAPRVPRRRPPSSSSSGCQPAAKRKVYYTITQKFSVSFYYVQRAIKGYDGDHDPPSLGGDDVCPHCRLSPCIITRPPNWLRGSSQASLANQTKRYPLYKKFWTLLGQLGVWNDPHYLALKATKTRINDRRDVMPLCIVNVSNNTCSTSEPH